MAGLSDLPITEANLSNNLLDFYDDFVTFQGRCAFLCEAIKAMTTTDMNLDDASTHGLHIFADEVKENALLLKLQLQKLQEASIIVTKSND